MDFTQSISEILKIELWYTDKRGSTTVGRVLLYAVIFIAITGIERWYAHSKKTKALAESQRIDSALVETLEASATYGDGSHGVRAITGTIEKSSPVRFTLSLSETCSGIEDKSTLYFSSLEKLAAYLNEKTILRIGDFKAKK